MSSRSTVKTSTRKWVARAHSYVSHHRTIELQWKWVATKTWCTFSIWTSLWLHSCARYLGVTPFLTATHINAASNPAHITMIMMSRVASLVTLSFVISVQVKVFGFCTTLSGMASEGSHTLAQCSIRTYKNINTKLNVEAKNRTCKNRFSQHP